MDKLEEVIRDSLQDVHINDGTIDAFDCACSDLAKSLSQQYALLDKELAQKASELKPRIEPYRSGGFINKDYDMARISVDLPIIEAKKLMAMLSDS